MLRNLLRRLRRDKKGQGLVEYGLLIAGVALISAAAVSVFGHKTSDLVAAVAAILPGAHADDNGAIVSGKLIETTAGAAGTNIALDVATIQGNSGNTRLSNNIVGAGAAATGNLNTLVVEAN